MNKLVLPLYKVVVDIETSFATVLHSLRCNIDYLLEKTSEQQLRNYLIVEAE